MGRPGAAARRQRLALLGIVTPRTIAREKRAASQEEDAPIRLPNGHATLALSRTELAILERLIADRLLSMRTNAVHGRGAELTRGRTRTLGTRISRLIAEVGDGAQMAQIPRALNIDIHELHILDDLVEPLADVPDDAACEELLDKIENLFLRAAGLSFTT